MSITCQYRFTPSRVTDYATALNELHRRTSESLCQHCGAHHMDIGKPVTRRKIANHTYLERLDGDTIGVKFHDTFVVRFTSADTISLHTGGWLTISTAARINEFTPPTVRVASNKGTWELRLGSRMDPYGILRFIDGITVARAGTGWLPVPGTTVPVEDSQRQDRHNTAMRTLIGKYLKGLDRDTLSWVMDEDHLSSECVLCRPLADQANGTPVVRYHPNSERHYFTSVGDGMDDVQHLVEHLHEHHYSSALVTMAVTEAGYNEVVTGHLDIVKRSLRKYLANRLYVGATAPAHGKRPVLTGATA